MKIIEFDHTNPYRLEQFIDLPFRIYQDTPQWVPPLASDTHLLFDHKNNPFYQHSEAAFFLAITGDGSPVGRLAVLNNQNYNSYNRTHEAFFTLFECFDDTLAAHLLFEAGKNWANKQGLSKLCGPKGFNALDGLGLLVKGFQYRPAFGIAYNSEYYPHLLENVGFSAQSDIVSGYLSANIHLPEKIYTVSRMVQERRGFNVVNFRTKQELQKYIPKIMEMYNSSLSGTAGNVPLSKEEVSSIANQLLWFANPRLIKLIEKDDRLVGFLFAYPDISAALQQTKGQLYPFGWIQMLMEMKHTEWVNINGAGILEEFQGLGGTAILFSEMYKSILEGGFKHAELVQIGVDNDKMQRELSALGVDFYKTHRTYQLLL